MGEDEGEKHLLKELPATKIYSFATKIKDHILENEKVFENFPFKKGQGIRVLNAYLNNNPDFERELIDLSGKLSETKVNKTENPDALAIKRIFKLSNTDIESSSVEEILSEFDKLKGKEMQATKESVLKTINYFVAIKKELEEKRKNGKRIDDDDNPYYNMLFFGAP